MTALDLSTLTLTSGSHTSRTNGVCLLEAVAWFAGEQHSDHPACVCPVLAAYGRTINDLAPQDVRDRLREFVPRLVETNATRKVELQRAYLFADAAVRVFAPMALELAGLADQAAKLRCLPVVVDHHSANVSSAAAWSAEATASAEAAAWSAARAAWSAQAAGNAACAGTADATEAAAVNAAIAAARAGTWDAALEVFSRAIEVADAKGTQ